MSLPGQSKVFQYNSTFGQAKGRDNSRALVPVQKISSAQMEEKRKKGFVTLVMLNGVEDMYVKVTQNCF